MAPIYPASGVAFADERQGICLNLTLPERQETTLSNVSFLVKVGRQSCRAGAALCPRPSRKGSHVVREQRVGCRSRAAGLRCPLLRRTVSRDGVRATSETARVQWNSLSESLLVQFDTEALGTQIFSADALRVSMRVPVHSCRYNSLVFVRKWA